MSSDNDFNLKTLFIDFAVVILLFLFLPVIAIVISIAITLSREEGMKVGLVAGFVVAVSAFYYFRGRFNFVWSTLQIICNLGLVFGEFFLIINQLKGVTLEDRYAMVFMFSVVPFLVCINRQILDYLSLLAKAGTRKKSHPTTFNTETSQSSKGTYLK